MERERFNAGWNTKRPRRARRGGFTLLEILTVIGIILLLVAIGVIAFGALDQSGKATRTTLANLVSMFTEFETTTALREQPQQIYVNDRLTPVAPGPPLVDLWKGSSDTLTGDGPGPVTSGSMARYQWDAVANTQIVLRYLNRMPANKQIMTRLPGKQVHGLADAPNKGDKLQPGPPTSKTIDPPLILDAWNNPIIFVGSDGLRGVNYGLRSSGSSTTPIYDRPNQTVTSAGVFAQSTPPANFPKNRRPFFASAGPDGDFHTGDDNVYSFEQ